VRLDKIHKSEFCLSKLIAQKSRAEISQSRMFGLMSLCKVLFLRQNLIQKASFKKFATKD
jgi:hypothetical protein